MTSAQKNTKLTLTLPYTILAIVAICMFLTACDLHEEATVSREKMRLQETAFSEKVSTATMDEAALVAVARRYEKHGEGPLSLTVSYDPQSRTATAMHATDEVARMATVLRKRGVRHVETSIMPVKNSGSNMQVLINYASFDALGPEGCDKMLNGVDGRIDEFDEDYTLGCTKDTLFAKQIARPGDLGGRRIAPTTDGRRVANSTETYRTGVPNQPLEGESASGEE